MGKAFKVEYHARHYKLKDKHEGHNGHCGLGAFNDTGDHKTQHIGRKDYYEKGHGKLDSHRHHCPLRGHAGAVGDKGHNGDDKGFNQALDKLEQGMGIYIGKGRCRPFIV